MFSLETHVGRLVELRMASPVTLDELTAFHSSVSRTIGAKADKVVVCTDLLGARIFDQTVTERLTTIIREDGPRVERNAYLVGESALFSMQTERIIREAGHPNRRAFRSPTELIAWLGEVLTIAERTRLTLFLRDGVQLRRETKV